MSKARIGTAVHPVPSIEDFEWPSAMNDLAVRFTEMDATAELMGEIWVALARGDAEAARAALEAGIKAGAADAGACQEDIDDVEATLAAMSERRRERSRKSLTRAA